MHQITGLTVTHPKIRPTKRKILLLVKDPTRPDPVGLLVGPVVHGPAVPVTKSDTAGQWEDYCRPILIEYYSYN